MSEITIPIEKRILVIRGHRVLLDADLAELYGVTTGQLNQQVKRNRLKFPADFMFQLTQDEKEEVITKCYNLNKIRFSAHLPYAFTEHGVVMAANLLSSEKAVETSVYIVRAFVKMRQALMMNRKLAEKISELEAKVEIHDEEIKTLFDTLRNLLAPVLPKNRKKIGLK